MLKLTWALGSHSVCVIICKSNIGGDNSCVLDSNVTDSWLVVSTGLLVYHHYQ